MQTLGHQFQAGVEIPAPAPSSKLGFPTTPSSASLGRQLRTQKLLCKATVPLRILGRRLTRALGILTYHRIDVCSNPLDGMLCVSPARFHAQIEGLLRMGYEPWSLRKVVAQHERGETIPRNVFVVAFDDGYEGVYHHAWPVLRRFRVPATIFLATAYLDELAAFPFDATSLGAADPDATRAFRPLRSEQCAEMLASGLVDLGTHTHSHFDFRHRPGEFLRDLQMSLGLLRERFGIAEATFAFPYGFAGPDLALAIKRTDVLCGLTAHCRLVTPRCDPHHWGRFGASEFDTASSLAAKLDGWYSYLQDVWHQFRSR